MMNLEELEAWQKRNKNHLPICAPRVIKRARLFHMCCACGNAIPPGLKYISVYTPDHMVTVPDAVGGTFKFHVDCFDWELTDWLTDYNGGQYWYGEEWNARSTD